MRLRAAAGSFECSAPSAGTRPRRLTLRCARSQRVTGAAASSLRDQFGRRWAQNRRASFKTKESGKLKYGVLEAGNRPAMPLLRLGRVGSRPEDLSASKNGSVKTCHPSLPLPKSLYPKAQPPNRNSQSLKSLAGHGWHPFVTHTQPRAPPSSHSPVICSGNYPPVDCSEWWATSFSRQTSSASRAATCGRAVNSARRAATKPLSRETLSRRRRQKWPSRSSRSPRRAP